MVITYKMPALSYWLSKRKQYQPYVGLPNIMAGRFIVPELLQEDATPENLAQALVNLVLDKDAVDELDEAYSAMLAILKQGTAHKAALAIMPFLRAT
jgi:lipid-A-disaccharide synthase